MLELLHLLHDVDRVNALDIDQTKRCDVDAVVLKVFEIKRLDVLYKRVGKSFDARPTST